MAYAGEKAGRGFRVRWKDANGTLRSASGFTSREWAEEYGRARETGLRFYRFTRAELIEAISRLEAYRLRPAAHGFISGGHMADAIIAGLEDGSEEEAGPAAGG